MTEVRSTPHTDFPDATETGRITALAARTQRLVERWAQNYPGLLEPDYIAPVTTAFAFATPWDTSVDMVVPLQFELWVFAVDKAIDTDARTQQEAEDLAERFIAIAETGCPRGDSYAERALAGIRAELARCRLWKPLRDTWIGLFQDTFRGMITEWADATRLAHGDAISFEEYLANSDSCGFRLIRLTSWITSGEAAVTDHLDELMAAAWHGEVSSRLTNDLATSSRESHEHDLNALKVASEQQVRDRIVTADRALTAIVGPLSAGGLGAAIGLDRILRFGNGFYEITDFRRPVDE